MPLKVNEFVVQAKFGDEEAEECSVGGNKESIDLEELRQDIIRECLEKVEGYLKKRDLR